MRFGRILPHFPRDTLIQIITHRARPHTLLEKQRRLKRHWFLHQMKNDVLGAVRS
jgi:hypothetical protein